MSASPPPGPQELQEQLPLSAEEAQAVAEAMGPLQDIAGLGDAFGSVAEGVPGPGPKLAGILLKNLATHADLAAVSVETMARAVEFYVETQAGSLQTAFPPPHVAAEQFSADIRPLVEALDDIGSGPP